MRRAPDFDRRDRRLSSLSVWWRSRFRGALTRSAVAERRRRLLAVPRAAAPIDLTGYWVSVVTQDWRWRMVTPAKGDYQGIQMTPEARKIADAWDPAKDEAAGEQCRSYGAPALMSVPGRLHITWQDDNTLKVETDAGTQTRLLHFGDYQAPPNTAADVAGRLGRAVADAARQRAAALPPGRAAPSNEPPTHQRSPERRVAARRHDELCAPGTCARTASRTARTSC